MSNPILDWLEKGDTSRKGNLRTLRTAKPGSGRPERAEAAFGHSLIGVPEIVARQADVLPAERRDVLEQGRIDGLGFPKQSDGAFQVKRVPQCDGGRPPG
jgi:hypothetical protein